MDFWGKYIQNSLNLLQNLQETYAPWTANFQFLAKSLILIRKNTLLINTGWSQDCMGQCC